jgi:Ca2+-binding RTX toxin-like protein
MGGAGKDTLYGGAGFDTASWANATAGVKVSVGNNFNGDSGEGDKFYSIEKIEGSNFNDVLDGGNSADTLFGLGGNDKIVGGNSNDTLDGGAGDDLLEGGNGNDNLAGGDGKDELKADNGNDVLGGGAGNDDLDGGNGNDVLDGGAGNDDLRGGNGNDTFLFNAGSGTDTIADLGKGDRIDLSAFGTDANVAVDTSQRGKIFVDAGNNGTIDLTIFYQGSRPSDSAFIYADPTSTSASSVQMQSEIMIAA